MRLINEYWEVSLMSMRLEMLSLGSKEVIWVFFCINNINNNVNDLGFIRLRMVFVP